METGRWIVGVDLGQSRDFTTLAVLERAKPTGEFDPAMPLGTPYPEIVERAIRRDVEVLVIE